MLCVFKFWLNLLKLNLPEFFYTLNKLQILKSWNKDNPAFVFINGNIIKTNGKENINLPAYTITRAKIAAKIMIIDLMPLEIFLLDVLANQLSNK